MNPKVHADIALLAPVSGILAVLGTVLVSGGSWVQWFGVLLLAASPVLLGLWITRERPVRRGSGLAAGFATTICLAGLAMLLQRIVIGGAERMVGAATGTVILGGPLLLLSAGTAAGLLRAKSSVVPAAVAWAVFLALAVLAQRMAFFMTDAFGNDATAAIVIFEAPLFALCAWLGAVAAARVSSSGRHGRRATTRRSAHDAGEVG